MAGGFAGAGVAGAAHGGGAMRLQLGRSGLERANDVVVREEHGEFGRRTLGKPIPVDVLIHPGDVHGERPAPVTKVNASSSTRDYGPDGAPLRLPLAHHGVEFGFPVVAVDRLGYPYVKNEIERRPRPDVRSKERDPVNGFRAVESQPLDPGVDKHVRAKGRLPAGLQFLELALGGGPSPLCIERDYAGQEHISHSGEHGEHKGGVVTHAGRFYAKPAEVDVMLARERAR